MGIGKMRKVVTFRVNTPAAATTGGQTDSYSNSVQTRGELKKKTGSRDLSFGEIESKESYELTIRYQAAVAAILRSDLKVVIDGETYTVDSWTVVEEIKKYFVIKLNL